jgi:hypothetical protein
VVGAGINFLGYLALPHGHKKVRYASCTVPSGLVNTLGLSDHSTPKRSIPCDWTNIGRKVLQVVNIAHDHNRIDVSELGCCRNCELDRPVPLLP